MSLMTTFPMNRAATLAGQDPANLYDQLHARSLSDPEGFWGEAAEEITWFRPWDRVLDNANPPFSRWFPGGVLNTCYNGGSPRGGGPGRPARPDLR